MKCAVAAFVLVGFLLAPCPALSQRLLDPVNNFVSRLPPESIGGSGAGWVEGKYRIELTFGGGIVTAVSIKKANLTEPGIRDNQMFDFTYAPERLVIGSPHRTWFDQTNVVDVTTSEWDIGGGQIVRRMVQLRRQDTSYDKASDLYERRWEVRRIPNTAEYCEIAVGPKPDGSLTFAWANQAKDLQAANRVVMSTLNNANVDYYAIRGANALNGAVAAAIFQNNQGKPDDRLCSHPTVRGAVQCAYKYAMQESDRRYPVRIVWIRCTTTPQITAAELAVMHRSPQIQQYTGTMEFAGTGAPVTPPSRPPTPPTTPPGTPGGFAGQWTDKDNDEVEVVGYGDRMYHGEYTNLWEPGIFNQLFGHRRMQAFLMAIDHLQGDPSDIFRGQVNTTDNGMVAAVFRVTNDVIIAILNGREVNRFKRQR